MEVESLAAITKLIIVCIPSGKDNEINPPAIAKK